MTNLDKLLEIARAAYSGVTQYNVEINGRLLEKLLTEIKAHREYFDANPLKETWAIMACRRELDAELDTPSPNEERE